MRPGAIAWAAAGGAIGAVASNRIVTGHVSLGVAMLAAWFAFIGFRWFSA